MAKYQVTYACGHTDTIGNGTGVVAYTAYNSDGSEFKTSNVPRYRGVENPFGHIFKIADGINVRISPTEENGGDNLSKVFVCDDPYLYNDTNYNGYMYVGNQSRENNFIKDILFGVGGEIIPSLVGGSSTEFFCDFFDNSIHTDERLCGAYLGGVAYYSSKNGLNIVFMDELIYVISSVGTRLCFLPAE